MNTVRFFRPGGLGRAAPGRRLAWSIIALASLGLAGCQSLGLCGGGGCGGSPCSSGACGAPNPLQRVGQRLFNRQPRGVMVDEYEPGLIGTPMPVGVGAPVVSPPAGAAEQSLELLPADPSSAPIGGSGSSAKPTTSSRLEAGKAVYETVKPNGGPGARRNGFSDIGRNSDPLADLPSLSPPTDFTEAPSTLPVEAEKLQARRGDGNEPNESQPPEETTSSRAPGIRSFYAVAPRLAGGSMPSAAGWAWLVESGYRTVLDLRPAAQLRSEDLAAINSAGLRYVALSTPDEALEIPGHLARFASEIGQETARPLYFFDTDGSRASVLWYLHQVATQKAGVEAAAREAAEIGPRDRALWERAALIVEKLKPTNTTFHQTPSAPEPPSSPVPDREATTPSGENGLTTAAVTPSSRPFPDLGGFVAELFPANKQKKVVGDPSAWKPVAALAIAGLSVPLAFFGRTSIGRLSWHRASLPAPGRSPQSLPGASGA